MSATTLAEKILQVTELLDQSRELLLQISHDSVKGEADVEWRSAEQFFLLARNVEMLRRETLLMAGILNGEKPEQQSKSIEIPEGVTKRIPKKRKR